MEEKRYRCSVNPWLINKNESGDKRRLAVGFEPKTPTYEELVGIVSRGMAISYQYRDGQRKTENFIRTDIALVDIDGNRTIDDALQDPLVKEHALFLYTTVNHRPDEPRFRIVFGLARTITDVTEIKALSTALASQLAGDMAAVDGARIYFGSRNCKFWDIGNELSNDKIDSLISQGLDHFNHRRVSQRAEEIKGVSRSQRNIDPVEIIRTVQNNQVPVGSIKVNTSVFCPDHFDRNPSAFVGISQINGASFIHCRVCQTTRWVGAISQIYDFNSFDKVIHQIHDQGDIEIRLEETPFGEIEKSILLGGRIYKTSNEKLAIDKLRHGVMFVKSPKGSGKTQNLPQLMEPLISAAIKGSLPLEAFEEIDEDGVHNLKLSGETNYSILLIGHRRSLIREMSQRLGLACYLDDDPKDEGDRINADQRLYDRQKRYGICLDSLAKLKRDTYSLIIIDESEQVLSHFLSDTMKDKRDKIFSQLAKLLRKSDTIICLDADLSWVTFNTICDLAPAKSKDLSSEKREKGKRHLRGDEDSKPVFIYLNDYVIKNKTIDLYKSKSHLTEDLLQSLAENKKIFVASNSKKQVKQLYEVIEKKLKDKKILQITSENSSHKEIQNFIKNIKEEFIHYDAVLTSPSLSTGVDITFPNEAEEVDVVYGFFENNITHHFEIDQQISRVRHPKAIKIWISPQTLNYETDISIIRSHELAAIAYANTRSEVNLTDSYEATSTNEKLIRLACLVSSRERASMNHLRANFVRYKQTQGFDFNVIEVDEELSELGGKALNAANLVLTEHRIESLMTAKNIDHGTFIRISESKDSTFEVSEALSNAYWKSVIELFFRQDITKELIKKTEGNWMRKIKALEGLMSLHRDSDERTNTYSLLTSLKDTLIVNAATYRSVRNETTAQLLLALILNKTPIYKDGYFIFDREFCNDDLKEFASFVFDHKAIVECQLSPVRKDLREKATTQLGIFLSILGLSTEKARKDQKGGTATYYYKLSRSHFDDAKGVIDRRRLHPRDSYTLEYWTKIHESNGFTTPVYTKIEDQIGCTQYVNTYWLPVGKKLLSIKH